MVEGVKNFGAMRVSASGLAVQRARMDVFAENLANVSTTRTPEGGPYRRKIVTIESIAGQLRAAHSSRNGFEAELAMAKTRVGHLGGGSAPVVPDDERGVEISRITEDPSEGPMVYDPSHPDADDAGYVRMPNVELVTELLEIQGAARAYEANLAALRSEQDAARDTLRIGG